MKILAVIMARGGSKGLPGKNIKPLLGKPLLAYTIEEAKKSKYINRIVLSTDYEDIAEVGRQYGAEVPFMRPAELAEDHVLDFPVLKHAVEWLEENENYKPDIILLLVPTAPLKKAEHIDHGIKIMIDNPDADSVRSVVKSPKHPLKCWKLDGNTLEMFVPKDAHGFDEPYNMPRQKLPKAYINNGTIEAMRYSTLMNKNSTTGDKILGFEMPAENSVNVDDEFDFMMAEMFLKKEMEKQEMRV
ncbi:MAG: acylneuraminate cytidylyltransferase family protein [Patescibacteria group bacterium]|nr:acylneuraminate cytidylyltransferase family protein [Patescibacteria group bacterium]